MVDGIEIECKSRERPGSIKKVKSELYGERGEMHNVSAGIGCLGHAQKWESGREVLES